MPALRTMFTTHSSFTIPRSITEYPKVSSAACNEGRFVSHMPVHFSLELLASEGIWCRSTSSLPVLMIAIVGFRCTTTCTQEVPISAFYIGHRRNRPQTFQQRREFLFHHQLPLWHPLSSALDRLYVRRSLAPVHRLPERSALAYVLRVPPCRQYSRQAPFVQQ